ncbi:MAG TPA: hemerythrin domain-containing protein [Acidobacteriaceae bacterium]
MLRDRSLIPLSQQHHNGLSLCVLTERSLREDSSAANIAKLARKAIDRYELELVNHFEIEEGILFPAVENHALVPGLISEHRRLEALIGRLREDPSAPLLLEFTALLRTHIRREENELFEDIQRMLPRELLDSLGSEIDAKAVRICL